MDVRTKLFWVGYLFEVTSLYTGMLKDKINARIHEMWVLIDKCAYAP